MIDLPLGPEIDSWPRPLPARTPLSGTHVVLEPLHRRHVAELYAATAKADASFTYMPYGPFASRNDIEKQISMMASGHDPLFWAIRPVVSGLASGWLSLMDIQPAHASIELGHIWMSPRLQRTRAATEAMFLLLKRAADELGYRRLVWKCHSLNAPSIVAAKRLGFTYEGTLRTDRIVKGRSRDTTIFSITESEWPLMRDAIAAWLSPDNFGPDGTEKQSLASFRGA